MATNITTKDDIPPSESSLTVSQAGDGTQEELDDCVELDVVTRTAGNIDAER